MEGEFRGPSDVENLPLHTLRSYKKQLHESTDWGPRTITAHPTHCRRRSQPLPMNMGHCIQQACPSPHSTVQRPRCQSFRQSHPGPVASQPKPPSPRTTANGQRRKEGSENHNRRDNSPPVDIHHQDLRNRNMNCGEHMSSPRQRLGV